MARIVWTSTLRRGQLPVPHRAVLYPSGRVTFEAAPLRDALGEYVWLRLDRAPEEFAEQVCLLLGQGILDADAERVRVPSNGRHHA